MAKPEGYRNRIELLQGTLDMLILQTLRVGAQHGYGIGQATRAGSSEVLQVETGSLYPALHRLEKQGWIKSEWRSSEHNQRAKYYQLTASGKKQLASKYSRWNQLSAAIAGLMSAGESEGQA
jgi:transcriptional regulator